MACAMRRFLSLNPHVRKTQFVRCMATANSTFRFKDLETELLAPNQRAAKPDPENLKFGHHFSDHMLSIWWSSEEGWKAPRIHPTSNISLHPAAKVFHYAIECFEGMKAYRTAEDRVLLFRPDQNVKRFQDSTQRAVMPAFEGEELVQCLRKLVSVDKDWVPKHPTSTLYLRPTMIGTEPTLGVTKSEEALLFVITGPVGPYYPTGFQPVSLLADPQYVRAAPGGVGAYKMGSNYAPTIHIQIEALRKHDCQQVLWLYGPDHQITEVGTMNFFMYWVNEQGEHELVTPSLQSGLILPGVTRRSLVEMAGTYGEFKVSKRDIFMPELIKGLKENRVLEVFGAGTACVVSPVSEIVYDNQKFSIPTMKDGAPITNRLYKDLTDIQYGRVKSEWSVDVE